MIKNGIHISLLFAVFVAAAMVLASACSSRNRTVKNPEDMYGNLMNLPETARWIVEQRDTTVVLGDRPKIIVYYNEKGCTSCRMTELYSWKMIMEEAGDEKDPVDADFVFIFKSDPRNEEFRQGIGSMEFDHPVMCDPAGEFEANNILPKDELYHVFLLDGDNKIVLSGSPIFNEKLWRLYETEITALTD